MARKLSFAILVAALTLAVIEGLSRLALDSIHLTGHDEASWRTYWTQNHGETADLYYSYDTHDPILGWRAKPGLRDEKPFGNDAILNTNAMGLRGITTPDLKKTSGTRRILVLGDSFTFGEEVSDHETYPALLDRALPQTEVLNFGVHGFGHDQMLLLFRELGHRYSPDLVILGFVYDDIYRNLLAFRDFAKPRFELRGDTLELTGVPVPSPEEVLADDWKRLQILDALRMAWGEFEWRTGRAQARAERLAFAILDALLFEIRASGAEALFVHLPVSVELDPDRPRPTRGESLLRAYCQTRDAACLYLGPRLDAAVAQNRELPNRLHWGAGGHIAVAQGIRDHLSGDLGFKNSGDSGCDAEDDLCP